MTVDNIVNKEYKNPSEELVSLMDQFSDTELNRSELMEKILNKAKDENIEPSLIRKMIVDRLKAKGLSDRSITNAIPDELKDKKMQQVRSHRLEYVRKDTDREVQSIPEDIDQPVYREPDRVESRPQWNKDNMDTEQEQQFTHMKVEPNVPVTEIPIPEPIVQSFTVKTKLLINNGDKGQYTTDITAVCYPSSKSIEIEPIERASIVRLV